MSSATHSAKPDVRKNGREALTATPAKEYPEGFFTEPVRAWAQMQFESKICKQIDKNTKRFKNDFQISAQLRKQSGFNSHSLGIPGENRFNPKA